MKFLKIVSLLSILLAPAVAQSQTVDEVILGLQGFYEDQERFGFELTYSLYESHESSVIHFEEAGIYLKNEELIYSRMGDVVSITAPEYIIGLDHTDRLLFVANNLSSNQQTNPNAYLESLQEVKDKLLIEDLGEGLAILRITTRNTEIERYEIVYDKQEYRTVKLIIFYNQSATYFKEGKQEVLQQSRLEISYRPMIDQDKLDRLSDASRYILWTENEPHPATSFSHYNFINNYRQLQY